MIGFLSPDAVFYECTSWGHSSKAREIYEELYNEHCYCHAEDHLLSLGYLVLRARDAYRRSWRDDKWAALTEKQLEWIKTHIEEFTEMTKKDLSEMLFDQERMKKHFK